MPSKRTSPPTSAPRPAPRRTVARVDPHPPTMTVPDTSKSPARAARADLTPAFHAIVQRELAQRCDAGTPESLLWAAAHACRSLLAERWVRTQADRPRQPQPAPRALPVDGIPDGPRARQRARRARAWTRRCAPLAGSRPRRCGDVLEREPDAALGNGGLGRLAACFLDSLRRAGAAVVRLRPALPATACSRSTSPDGRQVEAPGRLDARRQPLGDRRARSCAGPVGFGGRVAGRRRPARRWLPAERVIATAYDFIVPGHGTERVSTLRQWQASGEQPDRLRRLLPRRATLAAGRERLSADIAQLGAVPGRQHAGRARAAPEAGVLARSAPRCRTCWRATCASTARCTTSAASNAIHLNDTHPALAPAELMRLLLDEHGLAWDEAWKITPPGGQPTPTTR